MHELASLSASAYFPGQHYRFPASTIVPTMTVSEFTPAYRLLTRRVAERVKWSSAMTAVTLGIEGVGGVRNCTPKSIR
jgi:hypothetical protein